MPSTYECSYLREFEHIAGSENLFPIFIEITPDSYLICCKDCFVIIPIHAPSSYNRVNIPEMPTSFHASPGSKNLFLGLQSGSIIMFDLLTQTTLTTVE